MSTPQARALELEGTWRIETIGLDVAPGVVDVENRGLVGASSTHHIRGDFRVNETLVTAFLHLRGRAGVDPRSFLVQVKGEYDPSKLNLQGVIVDEPDRWVSFRFFRVSFASN